MPNQVIQETVELVPIPPNTVQSVQRELEAYIKEGLEKHGKSDLLTTGEISVSIERTFPEAEAVHALFVLGGGMALEVFKQIILPWLKQKYETRHKPATDENKSSDLQK